MELKFSLPEFGFFFGMIFWILESKRRKIEKQRFFSQSDSESWMLNVDSLRLMVVWTGREVFFFYIKLLLSKRLKKKILRFCLVGKKRNWIRDNFRQKNYYYYFLFFSSFVFSRKSENFLWIFSFYTISRNLFVLIYFVVLFFFFFKFIIFNL